MVKEMTQQFENMKPNDHRWRLFMQNSSQLSILAPDQSRRKETQARPMAILLCIPTQSQHNSSSLNFKLLPSLPVNTANFQVSLQKKSKLQSSQKQENNKIETWWLGGVPQQPHLWCYSVYSKLTPSRSWKSKFLQLLRCPLLLDFFFVCSWFLCSKKDFLLDWFVAKFEKELQVGQQDIVLDCNYHFDSHEAEQLEVKWYFNKVWTIFAFYAPRWARAIKIKKSSLGSSALLSMDRRHPWEQASGILKTLFFSPSRNQSNT